MDTCKMHGWTSPPECPQCAVIERDALSESLRRYLGEIRRLRDLADSAYSAIIDHHSSIMWDECQDAIGPCPICDGKHGINHGTLLADLAFNRKVLNDIKRQELGMEIK